MVSFAQRKCKGGRSPAWLRPCSRPQPSLVNHRGEPHEVPGEHSAAYFGQQRRRDKRRLRVCDGGFGHDGRAWRRVIDDRLQDRRHLSWRKVTLPLYDLAAIGSKDDRGRPAIVLVTVG